MKRSENYKKAKKVLDNTKVYKVADAVKLVRKAAYANFTEALELHINLGIDTGNSNQRVRFNTSLPHGIGKSIKVLVISSDNKGKTGDVIYKNATVADDILAGKLKPDTDFNVVVATPSVMKDIAKIARLLGPKGMMPSPKAGTVTENIEKVLSDVSKGQVEIKNQQGHAVLHQVVGNLNFKDEQLVENIEHLLSELQKNTPSKMKKKLVQKTFLTSSMGPSIRIEN
ncbi:hypothetical protein CO178_02330 [candidate division WWE3 bacterium CG_4_9_14_3_um_filter_34_6]|uniref:Ribosomal protein n=1 Tax=candidate division WWE3 bacterium CG_4_9_14_3_um_filter_34_6 TaxID=1975079 RepID=A0A2M7X2G7_UNCKA|nr:MAG: hypothetical protein CO178_02330 [candidate division WWE3 bacterium CG_4_9_14_3_um_filter_34_6]